MIPPKIPITVFSLCRAPPIKFYVTGYTAMRVYSSLRSHTVGVSHVAHAIRQRGVMASLAYRVYGLGTQEPKGKAQVTYVDVIDM